jgi:hypothetical protein
MARIVCCWACRVELEPIRLADGSSAILCVACDVIGFAHEVALGGPLVPAETAKRPRRTVGAQTDR